MGVKGLVCGMPRVGTGSFVQGTCGIVAIDMHTVPFAIISLSLLSDRAVYCHVMLRVDLPVQIG